MPSRPISLVSLVVALSLFGDSMLYAVLPVQYDAFGLPVFAVGILLSANRFVRLLTNPLAGRLSERVGVRRPFLAAVGLGAGTTIAYGVASGLPALVVARMLWGTSWSFLRLGSYLTVLHYAGPAQLGRGMGAYNAISRLGSLVGMALGGLLADLIGARPTFVLFGVLSATGLLLAMPLRMDDERALQRDRLAAEPATVHRLLRFLCGDASGPTARRVASVHVGALWIGLAAGLVISTLGYLLRVRVGDGTHVLGLLVGVATLTGAVLAGRWVLELFVAPLAGALADRIGRPRAALAVTAVALAGLALLGYGADLGALLLGGMLAFIGGSALVPVLEAAAGDLAPAAKRASAMSRYATWWDLGSACGPALGYALVTTLGLPFVYTVTGAGLALVMCVFAWTAAAARAAPTVT